MDSEEKPGVASQELAVIPDQSPWKWPTIHGLLPRSIPTTESTAVTESFADVCLAWLVRSPSTATREAYARDVQLFLRFAGIHPDHVGQLAQVRPLDVASWRDHLLGRGLANSSVARKITVLRSLFAFLQVHGLAAVNPAHRDFVATPPVPRDGKTVGLSPEECRHFLDAPSLEFPVGLRDRALLAVLAFTGCRVGELCRLRVGDYKTTSGHKIVEIRGKGGKERRVPLNPEAFERIESWLEIAEIREDADGALFRPTRTARGRGCKGFQPRPFTPRAVQFLVAGYVRRLRLDSAVTAHSFRVTALTTARERGCDMVDLQDFAGHSDPKTTLSYIRNRDRLCKSPAYVLVY